MTTGEQLDINLLKNFSPLDGLKRDNLAALARKVQLRELSPGPPPCLHEGVVSDADLLDAGVIFGTGFAPFRGGPLKYARDRGTAEVQAALSELAAKYGERFRPHEGWSDLGDT